MDRTLESELEYLLPDEDATTFFFLKEKKLDKSLDELLAAGCERSELTSVLTEEDSAGDTSRVDASTGKQEETKGSSETVSENAVLGPIQSSEAHESELESFLHGLRSASGELSEFESSHKAEDEPAGNADKQASPGDPRVSEYARTMVWTASNISNEKELAQDTDWSCNKKGYRQRIISQAFQPEHNDEIWI